MGLVPPTSHLLPPTSSLLPPTSYLLPSGGDSSDDDGSGDGGGDSEPTSESIEIRNSKIDGLTCRLTDAEVRNAEPLKGMEMFNKRCASKYGKQLDKLVKVVKPTKQRACAATVVGKLLDHATFKRADCKDGVDWIHGGCDRRGIIGNRLSIDGVVCQGFGTYYFVEGKRGSAKQQMGNTLRVTRAMWEKMKEKRDALRLEGHGMGCVGFDLAQFAEKRLGAAFIIAYVFLLEEMKREVLKLRGSCGDLVDSHTPNSANPYAKFVWHTDNHAELDTPPGPYIEHSVTCQCSPGRASMAVAGKQGDLMYQGVGSFIVFPAWALHRTKIVKPDCHCSRQSCNCSLWKMAGFFEP